MAITMQGSWLIQVKSKAATYEQKFVVSGADSGNGTFPHTQPLIYVTGSNWSLNIIHKPTGGEFTPSAMRIKFPYASGSYYKFDIESNDSGNDSDFNDLVLTCVMFATEYDFLVYGNVKYYDETCMFNPCFRYIAVIDNPLSLQEALKVPEVYKIIKTLYPKRLPKSGLGMSLEESDAGIFKPLLIPLKDDSGIPQKMVEQVTTEEVKVKLKDLDESVKENETFSFNHVVQVAGTQEKYTTASFELARADRISLGKVIDRVFNICDSGPLPNALLKFQEYDRTSAELAGGPYTGEGNRESLGMCAADMNGNYLFRFDRTLTQYLEETLDTPAGGNTVTHSRPDVIAQLLEHENIANVLFETAPRWNISRLRRFDICVPKSKADVVPFACEGHNNVIQGIGNTEVGPLDTSTNERIGFSNYLNADGIISAYNMYAPSVRCASWIGRLDIKACLSNPQIKYYTVRYKKPSESGSNWNPILDTLVQSRYAYPFTVTESVEIIRSLKIDGSPVGIPTKAFLNVENDTLQHWTELSKITKARVYTSRYDNGPVQFRIEGFDSNGSKVANADDVITVYIDNVTLRQNIDIDIDEYVTMDGIELGNCALFTLPVVTAEPLTVDEGAPITIRIKADHSTGFLNNYAVYMHKGAIGSIGLHPGVEDAVFPGTGSILSAIDHRGRRYVHVSGLDCDLRFTGTDNEPGLSADSYYEITLTPSSGKWLEPDENYCSFGIYLHATLRHTDGSQGYPTPTHATPVLIGIQRL